MWWAEIWAIFDSSQKAELLPRVVTPRSLVSDLIACVEEGQLGGERPLPLLGAGLCFKGMPDPRLSEKPGNDPGMGGNGTIEEAYGASQIFTKNKSRVVWVWGRQPVVNQPCSALPTEPRGQQQSPG